MEISNKLQAKGANGQEKKHPDKMSNQIQFVFGHLPFLMLACILLLNSVSFNLLSVTGNRTSKAPSDKNCPKKCILYTSKSEMDRLIWCSFLLHNLICIHFKLGNDDNYITLKIGFENWYHKLLFNN